MKRTFVATAVVKRANRLRRRAALPNAMPKTGETWIV